MILRYDLKGGRSKMRVRRTVLDTIKSLSKNEQVMIDMGRPTMKVFAEEDAPGDRP